MLLPLDFLLFLVCYSLWCFNEVITLIGFKIYISYLIIQKLKNTNIELNAVIEHIIT